MEYGPRTHRERWLLPPADEAVVGSEMRTTRLPRRAESLDAERLEGRRGGAVTLDESLRERIEEDAAGTILRVTEEDGIVEVVQRLPDEEGTYLYHVSLESHPDENESLHWNLIGSVDEE